MRVRRKWAGSKRREQSDGWFAPEVKLGEVTSHESLKKIKLPKIDRSNLIFLTDIRGQAHYAKPYDLAIGQFDGRSS
jgi:hypothetical protein